MAWLPSSATRGPRLLRSAKSDDSALEAHLIRDAWRLDWRLRGGDRGIRPNPSHPGLLPHGLDVAFAPGATLEAALRPWLAPIWLLRSDAQLKTRQWGRPIARWLRHRWPTRQASDDLEQERREFLVEAWKSAPFASRLKIECQTEDRIRRASFPILPGRNVHRLPASALGMDGDHVRGRLRLSWQGERPEILTFSWLHLVRYWPAPEEDLADWMARPIGRQVA